MNRKKFYINIFWQFVLQGAKYLYPLMLVPYLARVLEPSGYSLYIYILSITIFCQVFVEYGFSLSGTKDIAHQSSSVECGQVAGSIIQARAVLSCLACCSIYVFSLSNSLLCEHKFLVLLFGVAACARSFTLDFIFQGKEKMKSITTRVILSKTIATIPVFFTVSSSKDISYVAVFDVLGSIVAYFWALSESKKLFSIEIVFVGLKETFKALKRSWLYCFSDMSALIFTNFSTIVIGTTVTNKIEIAYWGLAMTALGAVQALYAPVLNALYPHIVIHKDKEIIRKLAYITVPVIFVGTMIYISLADFCFLILGGKQYISGSYVMVYTSPVLLLSFFSMYFGWPVLGAYGYVKEIASTTIGSAAFCIVALLIAQALGEASLTVVCIIRCITELLLCSSRIFFCWVHRLL